MKKRLRRCGRPPQRPRMAVGTRIAVVAGTLALAIAPPAQATPGLAPRQPAGPCSQNATPQNAEEVRQACAACLAPLYPPPGQPPPTPYQAMLIPWECGQPGAYDPAQYPYLQGAPGNQQR